MARLTEIPVYLEAKDKNELIQLMLDNNVKFNSHFIYSTPVKDGKKWITWFYADLAKVSIKGMRNGDKPINS